MGNGGRSRSGRRIPTRSFVAGAGISLLASRRPHADTSGKAREGWMAVIPASVFLVFVVFALGGPRNF